MSERDAFHPESNRAMAARLSAYRRWMFVVGGLLVLTGYLVAPDRLFMLVMPLCLGGACTLMALLFLWALCQGRHGADRRLTFFGRAFRVVWVVSFCTAGSYFAVVKPLGDLAGGTTNSGEAGVSADGTCYVYAWWKADKHVPVTPEKYWTLYWCEHPILNVVMATPFLLFGLMVLLQRLRGERVFDAGPAGSGRNGQAP